MDPTKALEELLARLDELGHGNPPDDDLRAAVLEQMEHLSQWLRRGGFPPDVRTAIAAYYPIGGRS